MTRAQLESEREALVEMLAPYSLMVAVQPSLKARREALAASVARVEALIAAEQAAASVPSCEGARGLDASEALREARVQGMREGLSIAKGYAYVRAVDGDVLAWPWATVDYEAADTAIEAAIEAVRKGER